MLKKLLVLLSICSFAITEPVLTTFGANPELFFFHNVETTALGLTYALTVALVPALVLWLFVVIVTAASARLGHLFYLLFVGVISALWMIQLLKWGFGLQQPVLLALLGGALGVGFVIVLKRLPQVETGLQFSALAPLLILGIFLFDSNTGAALARTSVEEVVTQPQPEMSPVVFILLDEFPTLGLLDENGGLDTLRFPSLGELASEATWYRHYSVLHQSTKISVPVILSGSTPIDTTPDLANYPDNLFTLLAPTHHLTVFESVTSLCGLETCSESAPGEAIEKSQAELDKLFSKSASLWLRRVSLVDEGGEKLDDFEESFEQTAVGIPKRMAIFLDALYPGKPALYYLHLQLPHIPWRFYPSGDDYSMPIKNIDAEFNNKDGGEWASRIKEYRFLMQAQHVDTLVGIIIRRLKESDMWDQSLVLLTADHGRSFRYGTTGREMRPDSLEGVAYAPLFVKRPYQKESRIDDSNLMSYDILPTIAAILDIDLPSPLIGFPAGAPEIEQRGDTKEAFRRSKESLVGKMKPFSDKEHFPRPSSRWIGSTQGVDDQLDLLNSSLDLDHFLNRSTDGLSVRAGSSAAVKKLPLLQKPEQHKPPLGAVIGSLDEKRKSGKVLVAVNGRIVTGSPLITYRKTESAFFAMLPLGVLQKENKIEVYLVDGEDLIALSLRDDI